ncbi:MAG: B12-binding domain-containing radical SAM protein [Nitrospiraceae bacterium]|nr:MAG: B12-binding domain-containing radical SAM protein [Nitrospiraceae bacterium]
MKILFIFPNANSQTGFHYGISHLSAVLKKAGHSVVLWQLCESIAPLPTKKEFIERIQEISPDIIGFSVVTNQWTYAKKLAAWAKEATSVPIVCGGVHTMAAGEEVLQSGVFDYIIRGEAEIAFSEFVDALARGVDVTHIKNVGFVVDGSVRINPLGPLPDLKGLPFKDYEIFDFQKIIDAKNGWVGLMGSRGCPYSCTYCFNHKMVEFYKKDLNCSFKELNYIRHFDVQQIIDEIQYLLKRYKNISMFIFDDDLFTFYKNYVIEFCNEYKKVSSLPFTVNAHIGAFDEERARHLSEANCRIVKFGLESGSERIRKQILGRHMKNESIIEAIHTTARFGMHASVFLMVGLPDETHDDVMATINLVAKALPGRFRWTFFFPYPGTKAYELSEKAMKIDHDKMAKMENFTDASCLDFGEEHNLFLAKVGKIMPWFVNANSDLPVADFYREKVETILTLNAEAWNKRSLSILDEDRQISERFVQQGLSHYAIKYNPFMGVISDYFTAEE